MLKVVPFCYFLFFLKKLFHGTLLLLHCSLCSLLWMLNTNELFSLAQRLTTVLKKPRCSPPLGQHQACNVTKMLLILS